MSIYLSKEGQCSQCSLVKWSYICFSACSTLGLAMIHYDSIDIPCCTPPHSLSYVAAKSEKNHLACNFLGGTCSNLPQQTGCRNFKDSIASQYLPHIWWNGFPTQPSNISKYVESPMWTLDRVARKAQGTFVTCNLQKGRCQRVDADRYGIYIWCIHSTFGLHHEVHPKILTSMHTHTVAAICYTLVVSGIPNLSDIVCTSCHESSDDLPCNLCLVKTQHVKVIHLRRLLFKPLKISCDTKTHLPVFPKHPWKLHGFLVQASNSTNLIKSVMLYHFKDSFASSMTWSHKKPRPLQQKDMNLKQDVYKKSPQQSGYTGRADSSRLKQSSSVIFRACEIFIWSICCLVRALISYALEKKSASSWMMHWGAPLQVCVCVSVHVRESQGKTPLVLPLAHLSVCVPWSTAFFSPLAHASRPSPIHLVLPFLIFQDLNATIKYKSEIYAPHSMSDIISISFSAFYNWAHWLHLCFLSPVHGAELGPFSGSFKGWTFQFSDGEFHWCNWVL